MVNRKYYMDQPGPGDEQRTASITFPHPPRGTAGMGVGHDLRAALKGFVSCEIPPAPRNR